MRLFDYLDDALAVTGTALMGVGLWLIYPPAALVVVGAVMLLVGLYAARAS